MAVACGLQLRLQTFWGWANGMMVTGTVGWKTSEQLPLGIRLAIFSVAFLNECKQYILHTYSIYFLARKRMASGKSSRGSFFVALLRTKGWTPKTMIRNPCPNEKWLEKADFLSFLVAKWWAWTGMNHTAPLFIDPVKCLKCAQLHLKSILHQHMTSKQCIWKGASHIHQLHARIAINIWLSMCEAFGEGDLRTKDLMNQFQHKQPSHVKNNVWVIKTFRSWVTQVFLPSDVYLESISNISVLLSNLWPDSPNTSHHLANPRYMSQNQSSQLWRLVFHQNQRWY